MKKQLFYNRKSFMFTVLLFQQIVCFGQWEVVGRTKPCFFTSSVAWNDKVYIAGGILSAYDGIAYDSVEIYNLKDNTKKMHSLSVARGGIMSIAYDNKIYFAGGLKYWNFTKIEAFSTIDIYNTLTDTWTTANLSQARGFGSVSIVGGKIMFAGGVTQTATSNVIDIYDPEKNTWETKTLSEARCLLGSAVINDKVMFVGGISDYMESKASKRIDIYDATKNVWTIDSLPNARGAISVVAVDNYIIAAGGYSNNFGKSNIVDIWDIQSNKWSKDTLSSPRSFMASAKLGKKAFFIGGGNMLSSKHYVNTSTGIVDVFDTATKKWSKQNLNFSRALHTCTTWDNKIIVAGGWMPASSFGVSTYIGEIEILKD